MCTPKAKKRLAELGLVVAVLFLVAIAVFVFTHAALVSAAIIVWALGVGGYALLTALVTRPPVFRTAAPAIEPPRRRPAVGMPARPAIVRERPAIEPTRVLPPYVAREHWESARERAR